MKYIYKRYMMSWLLIMSLLISYLAPCQSVASPTELPMLFINSCTVVVTDGEQKYTISRQQSGDEDRFYVD